jgi:hypothetical protein
LFVSSAWFDSGVFYLFILVRSIRSFVRLLVDMSDRQRKKAEADRQARAAAEQVPVIAITLYLVHHPPIVTPKHNQTHTHTHTHTTHNSASGRAGGARGGTRRDQERKPKRMHFEFQEMDDAVLYRDRRSMLNERALV